MKKLCIRKDGKEIYKFMWITTEHSWYNISDGHTIITSAPKLPYSEHSFKLGTWYD